MQESAYTLDNIHEYTSYTNSVSPIYFTCMFLDWRRKPEDREKKV